MARKEKDPPPPKPPTMAEAMREQSQMLRSVFEGVAVTNRELAAALHPPERERFGQHEPVRVGEGPLQHAYMRSARRVLRRVPKTHWRPRAAEPGSAVVACHCRRALCLSVGDMHQCHCHRVFLYTGRGMFVVNVEKLPEIADIMRAAMVVVDRS